MRILVREQGFSNSMSHEKCVAFYAGECQVFRTDNTLIYDRQGYIDRVLSFAAVSIFVLLLGLGLIMMYFEDLFS